MPSLSTLGPGPFVHHACGKFILLGEHFVVYGGPALALPLLSLRTTVEVEAGEPGQPVQLDASLGEPDRQLAAQLLDAALLETGLGEGRGLRVKISSRLPIGQGLGSSAAVSVALLGALARAAGHPLEAEALNAGAHRLERICHGQPSGIDNTVVAFERPVWFRRGQPPHYLAAQPELPLLLAGSGVPGSTRAAVARVAALRGAEPECFDGLCVHAAGVASQGLRALQSGQLEELGAVLDESHRLLQHLRVSTARLDELARTARQSGALGAKLTGSGLGGFLLVLARPGEEPALRAALSRAGADPILQVGALPGEPRS